LRNGFEAKTKLFEGDRKITSKRSREMFACHCHLGVILAIREHRKWPLRRTAQTVENDS
jgi:hypothetical protein